MLLKLLLPNTIQWGREVLDYNEVDNHIDIQLIHRNHNNINHNNTIAIDDSYSKVMLIDNPNKTIESIAKNMKSVFHIIMDIKLITNR